MPYIHPKTRLFTPSLSLSLSPDAALTELHRTVAVKGKLESLCRELSKQNKAVMEDSKRIALQEHEKRTELSEKYARRKSHYNSRVLPFTVWSQLCGAISHVFHHTEK